MKNFEQIAETPEALGAFLAALPVADGPWDAEFRRVFCAACSAENCDGDNCPHSAERNNPLWWLIQTADRKKEDERKTDNERRKALANEMMDTFQKQGLTCREVEKVLALLRIRTEEQSSAAVDKTQFTAKHF